MIARVSENAHLVLHLNHNDRMLLAIDFADVPHQGRKGVSIRVPGRIAKRREEFQWFAPLGPDPGEPLEILLHPIRWIAGQAVLPAREPDEDEAQFVIPGFLYHAIDHAEVELPFRWFDLGPGNARQNAI